MERKRATSNQQGIMLFSENLVMEVWELCLPKTAIIISSVFFV